MPNQRLNLIAVYGTLRRGGPANHYMEGCKFVTTDAVKARLYKLGWYPGIKLCPSTDNHTTVVDVYELPTDSGEEYDKILRRMDIYEGYVPAQPRDSLFIRRNTELLNLGKPCFVYSYNHPVKVEDLIDNGDWIEYVTSQNTQNAA